MKTATNPPPINDAGKQLRAATPDIVAALQAMTDRYAKAMKDSGVSHYPEALVEVRQARAAIAKANNTDLVIGTTPSDFRKAIEPFRGAGWAVSGFTPEEVERIDRVAFENHIVHAGNAFIEDYARLGEQSEPAKRVRGPKP